MTGWSVDAPGVRTWLGTLETNVSDLRSAVDDAEEAFDGVSGALQGPVAAAFRTFAATRRDAPAELVTVVDNAVGAAVGSVAALSIGNEDMAEELRAGRVRTADGWSYVGMPPGVTPW
ncbi:DUF6507 family protein [Pseudactinotalea sp.]|uniref:DUF6507 family protein n=1 Tax=Pseudactinotalea sp. TaxID=1926260 RepID=UPI003B3A47B3